MEDLSQKLTEILQDPGRMQQIMEMASAMGLQASSEPQEIPVTEETIQQVSQIMHRMEEKDNRQQTLIRALLPYLSPRRQQRLERAMQFSNLSRLAEVALQNNRGLGFSTEEGSDV